jgi:cytochrome c-type biogenesis protein CcsB
MISAQLVTIVTFLYLGSSIIYITYMVFQLEKVAKIASRWTWIAFLLHSAAIIMRWIESYQMGIGHAPLTNMYESLVFYSWCITLLYLLWEKKMPSRLSGALVMPLAFFFIAYAALAPGVSAQIDPLIPALQSNWLHAHVLTCFLSYASFTISCALSILYLIKEGQKKEGQNNHQQNFGLENLETLIYKTIALGFPLLTIGIITGAAWANYAWGSYWSWDPKETWSLITWFIYALFLHARLRREWRGKRLAILSIVGFGAVLFTYFGVNYVLSGLHSYV